ncbi:hypothetical protein PMAYCL1PPCAC_06215, partial [Pristionchus mayeri]
ATSHRHLLLFFVFFPLVLEVAANKNDEIGYQVITGFFVFFIIALGVPLCRKLMKDAEHNDKPVGERRYEIQSVAVAAPSENHPRQQRSTQADDYPRQPRPNTRPTTLLSAADIGVSYGWKVQCDPYLDAAPPPYVPLLAASTVTDVTVSAPSGCFESILRYYFHY